MRRTSRHRCPPPLARSPRNRNAAPPLFRASRCAIAADIHPRHNEDRLLVAPELGLAGVFDGVGGSAAGEVAARLAALAVRREWERVLARQGARCASDAVAGLAALDLPRTLDALLQRAHAYVRHTGVRRLPATARRQDGSPNRSTTAALTAIVGTTGVFPYLLAYAWVGDSRVYLLRARQSLLRLTRDDGVLTDLVREGILSESAAQRIDQAVAANDLSDLELQYFRMRNGITQALGDRHPPAIHSGQTVCGPGDRILLCSDGIHDNLTDDQLERILRWAAPGAAAREIVGAALAEARQGRGVTLRAKHDDMSAIVLVCE